LRRTPDKGLGYGVLKYMNRLPSLQGDDPWEITFDYLDQADALFDINPCIKKAKEFPEYSITEERMLNNKMAVTGIVTGMELQVKWSYNADLYNIETIDYLATRYLTNLQQIITHCTEQKKKGTVYTPSDYGLTTEISYQELDRFINKENTDMNNVMSF
jgi:non-ribosomal peptide synthase protein (TIGR01720 family)